MGSGNIILVGMMGAGKTTIGKSLAQATGKTFIDSDHEIQERTGVKIPLFLKLKASLDSVGVKQKYCVNWLK